MCCWFDFSGFERQPWRKVIQLGVSVNLANKVNPTSFSLKLEQNLAIACGIFKEDPTNSAEYSTNQ